MTQNIVGSVKLDELAPDRRRVKAAGGRGPLDFGRWAGLLFVAPALIFFGTFVLYPLLRTVQLAFYEWNGIGPATFVGLENFIGVFADPGLREALSHSGAFLLFYCVLPIAIGLVLAGIMGRAPLRGLAAYRTILFLPQVISLAVTGIAWRWMYAETGAVNQLLRVVGLGDLTRAWLGDFDWALLAVGLVGSWVMFGFTMVLFLVGVQSIDPSLYEAARVDGAGAIREFFAITLPGLRPQIGIALTLTAIAALRSFDLVYVTTNGGPGYATEVLGTAIYKNAFSYGRVGVAAAMSILLAVLIFFVIGLINRLSRER